MAKDFQPPPRLELKGIVQEEMAQQGPGSASQDQETRLRKLEVGFQELNQQSRKFEGWFNELVPRWRIKVSSSVPWLSRFSSKARSLEGCGRKSRPR